MKSIFLYLIYFNFIITAIINDYHYFGINDNSFSNDINSNAIYEMIELNDTLWLRTGSGLSFILIENNQPSYYSINNNNLPEGGSPAFIIDSTIMVISGSKSIYENNKYRPMGTGISWSSDSGHNWKNIHQPVDSVGSGEIYTYVNWGNQDSIIFKAITTDIYNISYDLDIMGDYIYATSFAGGFRRFNYTSDNPDWELIPLPMDNQSSLLCNQINIENYEYDPVNPPEGNDNHKAFSVFVNDNIIWVGTGDGINKGIINLDSQCIDWTHYNKNNGMGDRWVIGIKNQKTNNNITGEPIDRLWAISWDPSLNSAIPHNLSYTDDQGDTWGIVSFFKDIGAIVYDLNFEDDEIYASTNLGLFKTYNENIDLWFSYDIYDFNGQPILTDGIYSSSNYEQILWAGSSDGIFYSYDKGNVWYMYRSWNHTNNNQDNKGLSAYPNPFYIDENNQYNSDGHVRIVYYDSNNNSNAQLDIFDFNMTHIMHLNSPIFINNQGQFIWNGRNTFNNQVQNGVYFCRLTIDGKIYWTKLMVINT